MSLNSVASSQEILDAFETATTTLNLCPNRVWAVARHGLPRLIQAAKAIPRLNDHEQCTIDFCEHSQRDFTAVKQRHECKIEKRCTSWEFQQYKLNYAAKEGSSTVWAFDGLHLLAAHRPYMAISHVWSDGTGTGLWPTVKVNKCLYFFFQGIAERLGCEGMWWDTISIPKEKVARTKAIRRIQTCYQDARMTLVHDCFLRNSRWVDAEAACFAILMSPWFSRGWTALELANSRKVKVLFKGPHGLLIKDLDEEILAKDEHASEAHKRATSLIKSLRKGVTTLDDLLVVLGARCTSWPKDMAAISGLLVGIDVEPQGQNRDVLQQDIYKSILTKIGTLATGHLFHNSATISKGSSWCPINLFSMPISGQTPSLTIEDEMDLIDTWDATYKRYRPTRFYLERHTFFAENATSTCSARRRQMYSVNRVRYSDRRQSSAGKIEGKEDMGKRLCFQYVGTLHFHLGLLKKEHIKIEVRILGDASHHMENDQAKAWECVKVMASADISHPRESKKKTAQRTEEEAIKALWPIGSRPVREAETGRTALHYAVLRDDYASFQNLLKVSNIEARDTLGQLPLHLAAERGRAKMLQQLLTELSNKYESDIGRRKAILHTPCKNGPTVLHCAVFACSKTILEMLLDAGVPPNLRDKNNNTALHMAIKNGCEPLIGRLLKAGADPNLVDNNNNTAFFCAVSLRDEWLVRLLVRNGADVNKACGSKKETPLRKAIFNGDRTIIEFLIKSGADTNAKDVDRLSLLHVAVNMEGQAAILLLINGGAEVNARDDSSLTPLHHAARQGSRSSVELLVRKGANINARGWRGSTPLDFARRKGHHQTFQVLSEALRGRFPE